MGSWLAHPLTRGLALDDPRTTLLRRRIVQEKPFLRRIYEEWYRALAKAVPPGPEPVLEIGSGPGFLKRFIPGLITSEVFHIPGVDLVCDGGQLPFRGGSLRAVVMTDVLHHLPAPRRFLAESARCVRPGGILAMVEPWITPWSKRIYSSLHHEPMDPAVAGGELPGGRPLSAANSALPWILFERERARIERDFPQWQVAQIRPLMPFRYLLSGGVSRRSLMPGWSFGFWRGLEGALQPWMNFWAMFAFVKLVRAGADVADDGR